MGFEAALHPKVWRRLGAVLQAANFETVARELKRLIDVGLMRDDGVLLTVLSGPDGVTADLAFWTPRDSLAARSKLIDEAWRAGGDSSSDWRRVVASLTGEPAGAEPAMFVEAVGVSLHEAELVTELHVRPDL